VDIITNKPNISKEEFYSILMQFNNDFKTSTIKNALNYFDVTNNIRPEWKIIDKYQDVFI
jgi:hypothetical protein